MKRSLIVSILLLFAQIALAIEADIHALKAAYIYNFTKHISMPATSTSEFHITVVRNTATFNELARLLKDKTIYEKSVIVSLTTSLSAKEAVADIVVCDQLKAGEEEFLKRSSALVISEQETAGKSSTINFVIEDGKLRFQIFLTRAKEKDFKISSRLLNLAKVVE